jgi:hypothetical protein
MICHHTNLLRYLSPSPADVSQYLAVSAGGIDADDLRKLIVEALGPGHAAPSPAPTATSSSPIEKRWSVNLDSLLKYNGVSDVSQPLAPISMVLGQGPRKEERQILQAAIDNQARSVGASTSATLVVTKKPNGKVQFFQEPRSPLSNSKNSLPFKCLRRH